MGAPRERLPGRRELELCETLTADEIVSLLARGRARLTVDPRERGVRELIEREHRESTARLLPLLADLSGAEAEADRLVYELYRLPESMRRLVDQEYE